MVIRKNTYFFMLVVLGLTFLVYFFENKVHETKEAISQNQEKLNRYEEDLRVLEAEWSYLNSPYRLAELAQKTILAEMKSPARIQFTNLKNLPTREVMVSTNKEYNIIP